jgi:selenide,water dikinase
LIRPSPFGLAVNGLVYIKHLKQNNTAKAGDLLLLTKKIGVGILTTAEKKGMLKEEHKSLAAEQMMQLNRVGEGIGRIEAVHAMTDVTGFGLLGHLIEMAEGSGLTANLQYSKVPLITNDLENYVTDGSVPGGTNRNLDSYGHKVEFTDTTNIQLQKSILADPQTSGGLLIAVSKDGYNEVCSVLKEAGLHDQTTIIGEMSNSASFAVRVV